MKDNIRFYGSIVWLIITGCLVASAFMVLITWGDHLQYLYASAVIWIIASVVTLIASL
jgi:hypothetical protein